MASININKLILFGLLITIFSQVISYVDNNFIELGLFNNLLKLGRIIPIFAISVFFIFKQKTNYLILGTILLSLFLVISNFILLSQCCLIQYLAGLINLFSILSFLIITINPFKQFTYTKISNKLFNLIKFFFYGNIFLQIFQSFTTGSPGFSLKISLGIISLWIRNLGFFDIPSTTALASLSLMCVISKERIARGLIDTKKLNFTLFYFLPTVISTFLAGSGTSIIGLFIFTYYARDIVILDPFPRFYLIRKIFRSSFIINLLLIGLPLITILYFCLPFILGRVDILTSVIGRINIFKNIPSELSAIFIPLKNFGLYTNLMQSYGQSIYTNVSDSSITSIYVQYGLVLSVFIFILILTIFIKPLLRVSKNKRLYPLYILPFLPIFITSNFFEVYISFYSLLICSLPFKSDSRLN